MNSAVWRGVWTEARKVRLSVREAASELLKNIENAKLEDYGVLKQPEKTVKSELKITDVQKKSDLQKIKSDKKFKKKKEKEKNDRQLEALGFGDDFLEFETNRVDVPGSMKKKDYDGVDFTGLDELNFETNRAVRDDQVGAVGYDDSDSGYTSESEDEKIVTGPNSKIAGSQKKQNNNNNNDNNFNNNNNKSGSNYDNSQQPNNKKRETEDDFLGFDL